MPNATLSPARCIFSGHQEKSRVLKHAKSHAKMLQGAKVSHISEADGAATTAPRVPKSVDRAVLSQCD